MGLKYKLRKLRVRLKKSKDKDLALDDVQEKAIAVVIQMINSSSSELIMDPKNSRKGVKNKDSFICIRRHKLTIINGGYPYDVPIDDRIHDHITEKFYEKLTRRFNAIDCQIDSMVKENLDTIKDNLKNKES